MSANAVELSKENMRLGLSIKRQKDIENLKEAITNSFKNNLVSDVIFLEYPKWSIYYKNESEETATHSFYYNSIDAGIIYKFLQNNFWS